MGHIHILPEAVRNRIAAGEVVERPTSVVKELVENALDAGAAQISVEIRDGGRTRIRVVDDGPGIASDDIETAVVRHATSKIRDIDDIFRVTSMGFRGEALPSIAAVSRLEIISRTPDAAAGELLLVEGGEVRERRPASRAAGTAVTVRDLFFNTPARRKFLRSERAESAAIHEALVRLALAHPEAGFRLESGEKVVFETPVHDDVLSRVADLFGRDLVDALVPLTLADGDALRVSGFVARPPEARANSRGIHVFLNRRWIRHPALVHVTRQAFEGLLPARRYPVAFLFLEIDPASVDVNVHPTKEEVRFADERRVTGAVVGAVRYALRQASLPEMIVETTGRPAPPPVEMSDVAPEDAPGRARPRGGVAAGDRTVAAVPRSSDGGLAAEAAPLYAPPASHRPTAVSSPAGAAGALSRNEASDAGTTDPHAPAGLGLHLAPARRYRVIGQFHDSYLAVETPDGILLI
ncbi:MAG: DNA mismatch repair endonuclease MutL, partial [Planctomycetota bacterium]